ncbi:MAG: SDR family NAD(P)-dependent oxidoreductase [Cellulosilyticaceae bacterium]
MKKIAIITGASGGIGKQFIEALIPETLDEIWCIGRQAKKLDDLKDQYGDKIIPIALDLCKANSVDQIRDRLETEPVCIDFLINNAGIGEKLCSYEAFTSEQIRSLITVNCTVVVDLCTRCIPYMASGSKILNMASQSAFQPVPYLNLYASSKVFVRNYTRALNVELRPKGITATAVCPGWVDTEMLVGELGGHKVKYPGIVSAKRVVQKALVDARKNRDLSVCSFYVKYMHGLAKVFPQKMVMKGWMKAIAHYLE